MLNNAYHAIDSDQKLLRLLDEIGLDKTMVSICQNDTRAMSISKPYENYSALYRTIQRSECGIMLCFNETLEILEAIEISSTLFNERDIRGWAMRFKDDSDQDKLKWVEKVLMILDTKFEGIAEQIDYRQIATFRRNEICLKKDHPKVAENKLYFDYPEQNDYYPNIQCTLNTTTKDGKIERFRLEITKPQKIDTPISTWLHQRVIDMYPDFGQAYLWFEDIGGGIESLDEEYDFSQTDLPQRLDDWCKGFDSFYNDINPDWEEFNRIGRAIHRDLQAFMKDRYIITYSKSFEESYGNDIERRAKGLS